MTDHQEVNVVEYYDIRAPSKRPQGFAVAEGGNIWAQAFVTNGPIVAGEVACVELQLKNHSLTWVCHVDSRFLMDQLNMSFADIWSYDHTVS